MAKLKPIAIRESNRDYKKVKEESSYMAMSLLNRAKDTVIPELYALLGREKFFEFLEVFSGVQITVPSPKVILRSIEDCVIYKELWGIEDSDRRRKKDLMTLKISELSSRYKVSVRNIRSRYDKMKELQATYGSL